MQTVTEERKNMRSRGWPVSPVGLECGANNTKVAGPIPVWAAPSLKSK